jgi:regulator of sigma E protease
MMSFLSVGFGDLLAFVVVISVLVFFHELGHYLVARWCGVRVEVFSIGFGPELFGWNDRVGTRWRVSALPLGGYVKMFGDSDPASIGTVDEELLTQEERAVAFAHKRLGARTLVVAAGPIANFLLAFVFFAGVVLVQGKPNVSAVTTTVETVQEGSAAAAAGVRPGDMVLSVNDVAVPDFDALKAAILRDGGSAVRLGISRAGENLTLEARPRPVEVADETGAVHNEYRLGIAPVQTLVYEPVGIGTAIVTGAEEVWYWTAQVGRNIWRLIAVDRSVKDLGGMIRIGQASGEAARHGIFYLIDFIAVISVNLGLMNLMPIPVLDGGHLLFYAAEAVRGRPLARRVREFGMGVGLALILTLVVVVNWNDLVATIFSSKT